MSYEEDKIWFHVTITFFLDYRGLRLKGIIWLYRPSKSEYKLFEL